MSEIATINRDEWKLVVRKLDVELSYSQRAGNDVQKIVLSGDDFLDLYTLVLGVAQIYPELISG